MKVACAPAVVVIDISLLMPGPGPPAWCVTLLEGNHIASRQTLRIAELEDNEWASPADAFKAAVRANMLLVSAGYPTYVSARPPKSR
jgi:hypothetical protein